jgi:hypothetical protein
MNYQDFCNILNKHIFGSGKKDLLRKIAKNPERFIGLFRPTKPTGKILQHIFQSREIRMGDAFEEIIEEIIKSIGFTILPKNIGSTGKKKLLLDQYFMKDNMYYFIEQKLRDDHDSSKKVGQMKNFESKLKILVGIHGSNNLFGIMYFIDPDIRKNENYYRKELEKLSKSYKVELYLFYGKDLFDHLGCNNLWNDILSWTRQWKENLSELPQINFDETPDESFDEIKNLELRYWKKILENDQLWYEGIIKTIFRSGETLKRILNHFCSKQSDLQYKELWNLLQKRIEEYYK